MNGQEYIDELAGVVALPDRMPHSLMGFAARIRISIQSELEKPNPDNALIALLCDVARLGWEQIEWAHAPQSQRSPRQHPPARLAQNCRKNMTFGNI